MGIELREYFIYAGVGSTDEDVRLVDTVYFDNEIEARDYAELCAMTLYTLNPIHSVKDIMDKGDVSADDALEIFKKYARKSVVFFALEYITDNNGKRTMVRHY